MSKDPAFLFYAQDWITGTLTMTMEERGQFITILAVMHQKGRLDQKTIRFLVGNVSDSLKDKFEIDSDGKWFNVRLEEEIEKRAHFINSRRKNGSKGGRPRKSEKPSAKPNGLARENHTEDENVNEDSIDLNKETEFEIFWITYEKKEGLVPSQREWSKIDPQEYSVILEHVSRYVNATPDKKFRKKPENYLKDRVWLDSDLPVHQSKKTETSAAKVIDLDNMNYEPNPWEKNGS